MSNDSKSPHSHAWNGTGVYIRSGYLTGPHAHTRRLCYGHFEDWAWIKTSGVGLGLDTFLGHTFVRWAGKPTGHDPPNYEAHCGESWTVGAIKFRTGHKFPFGTLIRRARHEMKGTYGP